MHVPYLPMVCINAFIMHVIYTVNVAIQFAVSTVVTVSAESVDGPTPAARVTWNTTAPPECVASVMVEFRVGSHSGPLVATNTTNSTSQTEVIQTGLWCRTYYYIRVVVTGNITYAPRSSSSSVQVLVGGKEIVCIRFSYTPI